MELSGYPICVSSTEKILYRIPGELSTSAMQTLPDAVSCADKVLEVSVNDGKDYVHSFPPSSIAAVVLAGG